MIDLPTVEKIDFKDKDVLVRGDFDVDGSDNPRADSIREMVKFLLGRGATKIRVIGHTETDFDLAKVLSDEFPQVEFDSSLRKDPGEKENSEEFAQRLSEGWNVYINEAFATSHRSHASIVTLPKVIKDKGGEVSLGLRFIDEIKNLSKVFSEPKKPVIMVISGIKEDKLSYIDSFSEFADKILIGGKLPDIIEKGNINLPENGVLVADLNQDREDITIHTMEKFEKELNSAGTIVVSGPLGKFEEEGQRLGTERILNAVVKNTEAFKVAGGGDTELAISTFNLKDGFDWISVGGGAMLEYLANKTLPGIEALRI